MLNPSAPKNVMTEKSSDETQISHKIAAQVIVQFSNLQMLAAPINCDYHSLI